MSRASSLTTPAADAAAPERDPGKITVAFTLNGRPVTMAVAPMRRLTLMLREELGLTGTKVGCDAGDCGACTVLIDGEAVCACMVPAGRLEGRSVETVEALARDGAPSPLQESFLRHGAAQCGICTPGMLMSAEALLRRNPLPSEQEVKDAIGGVLCRCTGYAKIIQAVKNAATVLPAASIAWTACRRSWAPTPSAPTGGRPTASSPRSSAARTTGRGSASATSRPSRRGIRASST